jgi:putative hemolysin
MSLAALYSILFFLTFLSGFFSAADTALFSLSATKVKTYEKSEKSSHRLVANLLRNPSSLIVTILILNISVNILVQNVAANIFYEGGWLYTVGVPLVLTLFFGEIVPKSVAIQNNTRISLIVAPLILICQKALGPIRYIMTEITTVVSKFLFFFLKKEQEISAEELNLVLKSSEKHGVLHEDEIFLVQGYLDLQTTSIKELMRPRDEVVYFDIEDNIDQLISKFVDEECSRIPVCDGNLDKIQGIISSKDFFLNTHLIKNKYDLRKHLTKPFFVPETTTGKKLLKQFQKEGTVTAIVVDEYGQVTGLITREDLIETVVGDITDKRDLQNMYTEAGDNVIIANAKIELTELEEIFHVPFESKSTMVTLGGWLTEKLGDIPKAGTNFVTKEFFFHILSAEPNRVNSVYIRKLR